MSPKNSVLLITGATGFIGNHTVHKFIQSGYKVRVAVRNPHSGEKFARIHKDSTDSIQYAIVPDITAPGAFDEAVRNVDGVVHMASPFKYKIADNEQDLLIPAISGTTRILEAVMTHAPKVKRIVITSSFAAVNNFYKGLNPGYSYTEKDWNPITYQEAKSDTRGLAYAGSKKLAEAAAWDFVSKYPDLKFTIATINPPMVFGPSFPGSIDLKHLGQSAGEIYALINGSLKDVPSTSMPAFADVRDVALAHLKAFETDKPGRFLVGSGRWSNQQVCDLFREKLPAIKDRVPVGTPGNLGPDCYVIDTSNTSKTLGIEFKKFDETFLDMADMFLAMEKTQS